jgi:Ca2+-binding EF-hand superfamily protein
MNPFVPILLAGMRRLQLVAIVGTAIASEGAKTKATVGDAGLFERLDQNSDRSITADEVTKEHRQLFDRLLRLGDANHDQALSRDEFAAALAPKRPEKPMQEKEPATLPQANAIQYLLLTMDTNRDARIEKDEVPGDLKDAYELMAGRMDRDENGVIDRQELNRSGPAMSAMAGRYVARLGIDVDAKLASLKKSEGEAFDRFDQRPVPLVDIRDPKQARTVFSQLDENGDGKLDPKEVPEPLQDRMRQLARVADRDRDGALSQAEFVVATERIARFMKARSPEEMAKKEAKRERKGKDAPTDKGA